MYFSYSMSDIYVSRLLTVLQSIMYGFSKHLEMNSKLEPKEF
jgi:hypothetical protein